MNFMTEFLWLGQIVGIFAWKCRGDGYQGKWFSLGQAFLYIFLSDIIYLLIMATKGTHRELTLLVIGTIMSTIIMAVPFISEKIIRDDDPASEKVRRLTMIICAVSAVLYAGCMLIPSDGHDFMDSIQQKMADGEDPSAIDVMGGLSL